MSNTTKAARTKVDSKATTKATKAKAKGKAKAKAKAAKAEVTATMVTAFAKAWAKVGAKGAGLREAQIGVGGVLHRLPKGVEVQALIGRCIAEGHVGLLTDSDMADLSRFRTVYRVFVAQTPKEFNAKAVAGIVTNMTKASAMGRVKRKDISPDEATAMLRDWDAAVKVHDESKRPKSKPGKGATKGATDAPAPTGETKALPGQTFVSMRREHAEWLEGERGDGETIDDVMARIRSVLAPVGSKGADGKAVTA